MNRKEYLIELIEGLSKTEKRYFVLFASVHSKDSNYIKLFEALSKEKKYNEPVFKKKYSKASFIKHFRYNKHHLYQLILKSLQNYHSKASVNHEIKDILKSVAILYAKELYSHCWKLLVKAKKLAGKSENYIALLDVFDWELELSRMEGNPYVLKEKSEDTAIQRKKILLNLSENYKMDTYIETMMVQTRMQGKNRSKQVNKSAKLIINNLLSEKTLNIDIRNKFISRRTRSLYYFYTGNYKRGYELEQEIYNLQNAHPIKINEIPKRYIITLHNLTQAALLLMNYKVFLNHMEELRKVILRFSSSDYTPSIRMFFKLEYLFYVKTGLFYQGVKRANRLEQELNSYHYKEGSWWVLEIYYYIGYCYFGMKDYKTALHWFFKILNDENISRFPPLHYYTVMLHTLTRYELSDIKLLPSVLRSTQDFLEKRKRSYKLETCLLKYLRKISNWGYAINEVKLMNWYIQLHNELIEIIKDPFEKRAMEYFDFISWLESKIYKKPFVEIIREKAALTPEVIKMSEIH